MAASPSPLRITRSRVGRRPSLLTWRGREPTSSCGLSCRFAYAADLKTEKSTVHAVGGYFRKAWIVTSYPTVGRPLGFRPERSRFSAQGCKDVRALLRLQNELRDDFEALLGAIPRSSYGTNAAAHGRVAGAAIIEA